MATIARPMLRVPQLVDVDEKQYSADRGPCLQSARTLEAVRAVVGEH